MIGRQDLFHYLCGIKLKCMKLLDKIESVVTEVTYTLADDISPFYYKEWLNDSGKVIDSILRDKDGYKIDDPALLEEVQNFVDNLEQQN